MLIDTLLEYGKETDRLIKTIRSVEKSGRYLSLAKTALEKSYGYTVASIREVEGYGNSNPMSFDGMKFKEVVPSLVNTYNTVQSVITDVEKLRAQYLHTSTGAGLLGKAADAVQEAEIWLQFALQEAKLLALGAGK